LLIFRAMPERFPPVSMDTQNIVIIITSLGMILARLYGFLKNHGIVALTKQIAIWYMIFLLAIIGYAFRFEVEYIGKRTLAVIIPSYSWGNNSGELIISRSSDGHFYLDTLINNVKVRFMVDTGASNIALTKKDAVNLGFNLSKLNYSKTYLTANGTNAAAPLKLRTLQIGSSIFHNVEASVGKGELDISLLGMSVISLFKSFKIDKDLLTLTY
jgi:aspartyl protease family protein